MYRVIKRMEISGAHKLSLPYESKCRGLHGHNWIITVYCQSETLDENGMVVDFSRIKELVHGRLARNAARRLRNSARWKPCTWLSPTRSST